MPKRTVRHYDNEFKSNTVKLYFDSGKSYTQLSEDLNIPPATIAGWVNSGKYHTASPANTSKITQDELAELKQLRKELRHVKEERDILKKAVAIFSEERKN